MADTSGSSPFIKHEPDERANDSNLYMMAHHSYNAPQHFGQAFGGHQGSGNIDPSELSMQNGNYGMPYSFGSQQNLSSSFNLGSSGIGDDELLEGLDFSNQHGSNHEYGGQSDLHHNLGLLPDQRHPPGISMSHQGQMSHLYSSTPDGQPIQSPFLGNFDYNQFRPINSIPQHMSPHQNGHYMAAKRPGSQGMVRKASEQRSPVTPKTPAMGGFHVGTPESGSFPSQPIKTASHQSRHQKTFSNQWDSTPGSMHSYVDSPISSPGHPSHHTGISEVLKSGKHASLPAKVENGHGTSGNMQALETQEAKKRRRRASHNQVERRRRDNINERIQDLSHLVPQHRLDDDKVKKQLLNNSPTSPTIGATSMSPASTTNAATSLLAGANGRRAASTAGNITIGLPIEEKEKGPNKGDILNGSVSWTRDLMWALYTKYLQEEELAQHITQLGGTWPFEITEDEKRMRSELMGAMDKNDAASFAYSRTHGSGLRVPKHTNISGEPIQDPGAISPQSLLELSPAFHSGGSGTNSGGGGPGQPQFWSSAGHSGISFKEEDEFNVMDMN